jgi:hypothetical protein
MSTILTPPDLQIILGRNSKPFPLQGTSATFFNSRAMPDIYRAELWDLYRVPLHECPREFRGFTQVGYRQADKDLELINQCYGVGRAFLSPDDIFREDIGITLASLRAVTSLIQLQRPSNSRDIVKRISRWIDRQEEVGYLNNLDRSTARTLALAFAELEKVSSICRK